MLINIIDAYTIIIIFCEDSLDAILMQYEFRGIITDFKLEIYHKNFGKFQNQKWPISYNSLGQTGSYEVNDFL